MKLTHSEKGEKFYAPKWFKNQKIIFKEATIKENIFQGVDYWIKEKGKWIGVDVKNTFDLYFQNYDLYDDRATGRHPYRADSKAKYILLIKVSPKTKVKDYVFDETMCKGLKEVKTYYSSFFKSKKDQEEFTRINRFLTGNSFETLYPDIDCVYQHALKFKYQMKKFVKEGYDVFFDGGLDIVDGVLRRKKDNSKVTKLSFKIADISQGNEIKSNQIPLLNRILLDLKKK